MPKKFAFQMLAFEQISLEEGVAQILVDLVSLIRWETRHPFTTNG